MGIRHGKADRSISPAAAQIVRRVLSHGSTAGGESAHDQGLFQRISKKSGLNSKVSSVNGTFRQGCALRQPVGGLASPPFSFHCCEWVNHYGRRWRTWPRLRLWQPVGGLASPPFSYHCRGWVNCYDLQWHIWPRWRLWQPVGELAFSPILGHTRGKVNKCGFHLIFFPPAVLRQLQ